MVAGQLNINFVADDKFIKLVQIKDKSVGKLFFVPNQTITPTSVTEAGKPVTGFANIYLQFNDADGAKAAAEVLVMLAS